ncbi:LOB domain-containing protein 25-like [Sesamum indicum]|uniref:LOB domain-containing protein 25-like n=1 Tax=Sesamum indicum TaxID=4182 RepID=A0A6I9T8F5_SESIN|nr:LOB domain-containing protein 25-like [Sesamum indicum]
MTGLSSSCGACKFLRRRCNDECVFAPYFCYEQAATHFAAVHKVFGASNVSKLLLHLPAHCRSDAAITISYEALARLHDPIYGCVAHIFALQQQVASLEDEIEITASQLMTDLGVDIATSTAPYATSNYLYFPTQSNITSNCSQQEGPPILHSGNASESQDWCSNMELQPPGTEYDISQGYFNSSTATETLPQPLDQDAYLLEELINQGYDLHPLWMKNAAP